VGERIARIQERLKRTRHYVLSVHCHNDLGQAVANSLTGVMNGARRWSAPSTGSASGPATPRSRARDGAPHAQDYFGADRA